MPCEHVRTFGTHDLKPYTGPGIPRPKQSGTLVWSLRCDDCGSLRFTPIGSARSGAPGVYFGTHRYVHPPGYDDIKMPTREEFRLMMAKPKAKPKSRSKVA